jgi:hypothetical protein
MDYDFTEHYNKGDVVYHVRYFEKVGVQEVNKLTLGNSVNKTHIVGYKENKEAVVIGQDQKDLIFKNHKDAITKLKEMSKNSKVIKKTEIPSQLIDIDEEGIEENLDSYMDGDEDE